MKRHYANFLWESPRRDKGEWSYRTEVLCLDKSRGRDRAWFLKRNPSVEAKTKTDLVKLVNKLLPKETAKSKIWSADNWFAKNAQRKHEKDHIESDVG